MLTRRREPRGDAGATLAELVVCMALTTVVGAMALSFFLWTGSSTRATTNSSYSLQTARVTMTTVTGILRLAAAGTVKPSTPVGLLSSSVQFTASDSLVAGCAARPAATITLTVASGAVRLDRTGPQSAPISGQPCRYLTNQTTSRVLVTNVRAGTGFTTVDDTTAAAPTLTSADIGAVRFVLALTSLDGRVQTYQSTAAVSGDLS